MECNAEVRCDQESFGEQCIEGIIYGHCGHESCYGVCVSCGMCGCVCHERS